MMKYIVDIRTIFDKYGVVHIKNTNFKTIQEMKHLVDIVIDKPMTYNGGANNRNNIMKNVYDIGAPLEAEILFHHEMAYVNNTPSKIAFCCEKISNDNGWTWISDQIGLTKEIMKTNFGNKLFKKGVCYKRVLTDKYKYKNSVGIYNHWQDSFDTIDKETVVKMAKEQGLKTEWSDGDLITRYYQDAFEYCPITETNIMFSSLADHHIWFDTWPNFSNVKIEDRPLYMTFGDGEEFSEFEMKLWLHLYKKYSIPIQWEEGDVGIICNYRWAHGRPPIILGENEERKLCVILGDTFERVGKKYI